MKNMLNVKYTILYLAPVPGTVIIYGSGSDFLTSYGSGSTSKKIMVPNFLRFRFRFHNAA